MHLVYAVDEAYALPMAASLWSVVRNTTAPVDLTVLTPDLSDRTEEMLRRLFPTVTVSVVRRKPEHRHGLRLSDRFPAAAYLRLMMAEALPPDCQRAIYLDADTIAVADLTELERTDISNGIIAAVQDDFSASLRSLHKAAGLPDVRAESGTPRYFNSGVMVIDVAKWRSARVGERAMELCERSGLHDQRALNAVIGGDWVAVDATWNVMTHLYYPFRSWRTAPRDIVPRLRIRHFTAIKPWKQHRPDLGTHLYTDVVREMREAAGPLVEALGQSTGGTGVPLDALPE